MALESSWTGWVDQNVDQLDDPDPAVSGKAGSRPHVEETFSASVGQYHTIIWQDKKLGGFPDGWVLS